MIEVKVIYLSEPRIEDGRLLGFNNPSELHYVDTIEAGDDFAIQAFGDVPYTIRHVGMYRYYSRMDYSDKSKRIGEVRIKIHEGNPLHG